MALIYPDQGNGLPHTHALVIGVGGYSNLKNGANAVPQTMPHVGLLTQLTSPPRSAVAFAQTLINFANLWTAPLGSVDLLVSAPPGDSFQLPAGWPSQSPTINNIQDAYNAWKQRSSSNPDNISIFYYCGHGFEKEDLHLLAEDFGANPNNPWLNSFVFNATRLAFHGCKAKTQCFFIDACRKITSEMLVTNPTKIPLDLAQYTTGECQFNLTIFGTALSESALGPKAGVAYYTQALIRSLQGRIATKDRITGDWGIETGELSKRITDELREVKVKEGYPQRCSCQINQNAVIRRVPDPKSTLTIDCYPEPANQIASLLCKRLGGPAQFQAQHQGAPWSLDVEAGIYEATANFPPGQYSPATNYFTAEPPEIHTCIRV